MSLPEDESSQEDMSCDALELMDLPEPVLLHIFRYLGHDFLRHVVSRVSKDCKRLAHSQVLWSKAFLSIDSSDCWDSSPVNDFIRHILVTPYLHHLSVSLRNCEEDMHVSLLAALVSTRCRLYRLSLSVDDYGPEIMLFLQQHPELREIQLCDNATDNDYSAGVAATIRRLSHLTSLEISQSGLLRIPETGLLLASSTVAREDHELNPADTATYIPAGSEPHPRDPKTSLDLRNVDYNDCEMFRQNQPQGLLHVEFMPLGVPLDIKSSSTWASAGKNLSALLRAHKDTLTTAKVSFPCPDVFEALAECSKLEELSVFSDPTGSALCAMLQKSATLRRLHLEVPVSLGAPGLSTVLRTLCLHAPQLESLSLSRWWRSEQALAASQSLFPGFKPLQAMLANRDGRYSLRELLLSHVGPVGRAEFLELASMVTAAGARPSLRKLHVQDCPCSADRGWDECRDRAEDALRAAMPSLEYTAECIIGFDDRYDIGFMPVYSCDCERRCPRGHRQGRGRMGPGAHP
ncbi:uncharacterized protein LOC117642004 [Thrips palmi]|uniref:Uncharacterized protein LOC117642004 n=1 Tax=Thrips palmi TaxID=161013 RepID=A0A6P8Y7N3_THRPL|nr:uncharacterized protein LOC117642004 [Thrips palmi]